MGNKQALRIINRSPRNTKYEIEYQRFVKDSDPDDYDFESFGTEPCRNYYDAVEKAKTRSKKRSWEGRDIDAIAVCAFNETPTSSHNPIFIHTYIAGKKLFTVRFKQTDKEEQKLI